MRIRNEIKAGLFVILSLGLIVALIVVMGRDRQIFASQVEYYSNFRDVKGLSVGAPVRLGGIPIGRVAKVGFSNDLADLRVHVTLLINDEYTDRLKRDATVALDTQGLLGDRFVSITPGTQVESFPPNSVLPSVEAVEFTQILSRAQAAVENTSAITERINRSLEGLTPETFRHLGDAAKSLSDIFTAIQKEEGFVHRLIYSEKDGAQLLGSLSKAAQDVSAVAGEVKSGKGFLHALVYGEGGKEAVDSLSHAATGIASATDNLSQILATTKEGNGLLHDVIYNPVEAGAVSKRIEEMLVALNATAANLKVASDALASGTGTLGALIVDPKLYDNLVEVTDGAKRSFLLRQAIRSSLKQ